ncbi:hypothetical protein GQX74_005360 [Glossina fuscipes]|nr:hypothetical protein GQX74_005360 [Glossina fuscipes]
MPDLCWLLSTLVDKNTNILIPGIERDFYAFALRNTCRKDLGVEKLPHNEDKTKLLMHKWRYPSLSIHGIEGAFYEPGAKTVIPAKVIGNFSMRLVPNQDPDHAECGSPNKMTISSMCRAQYPYLSISLIHSKGSPNGFAAGITGIEIALSITLTFASGKLGLQLVEATDCSIRKPPPLSTYLTP